jgi:hypothetical protein
MFLLFLIFLKFYLIFGKFGLNGSDSSFPMSSLGMHTTTKQKQQYEFPSWSLGTRKVGLSTLFLSFPMSSLGMHTQQNKSKQKNCCMNSQAGAWELGRHRHKRYFVN